MPVIAMTARWVQDVKVGNAGRTDYSDTRTPGLWLRVSPTGKKTWAVVYRRHSDGRLRRVTIGSHPAFSLADARQKALEIMSKVERSEDPAKDGKRSSAGRPNTFGELAERYLTRHADREKRSGFKDRQMLAKDVLPALEGEPLESIKRADIADILDRILARGAPIQANRTYEIVRKLFNWAIEKGLIETSPCMGLRAPARETARERILRMPSMITATSSAYVAV